MGIQTEPTIEVALTTEQLELISDALFILAKDGCCEHHLEAALSLGEGFAVMAENLVRAEGEL